MSDDTEVTPVNSHMQTATPPNGQPTGSPRHNRSRSQHNNTPPPASFAPVGHDAQANFVRPSDLLRPKTAPHPPPVESSPPQPRKPERQIDRDERAGLQACRDFLRARRCYDVLPLSFRLIELDVGLTVRESLQIMVQCGTLDMTEFGGC